MKDGIRKHLKLNFSGTSLVEVMVSVSILGIVAIGAVSIGDQVGTQARVNRIGNNIFQVYEVIRSRTFMEQDCTRFVRNATGGQLVFSPNNGNNGAGNDGLTGGGQQIGISIPGAVDISEAVISEANPEMPLLGLQVESLRLTNAMHIDDGGANNPPQRYLAYVELKLKRHMENGRDVFDVVGGSGLYRKRIVTALYIETSAPGPGAPAPVDSCRSASTDIDREALCIGTDPDGDGVYTGGLGPKFIWDPVTELCIPPQEPVACPAGQVLTEIVGKTPICISIGIEDQTCPSGQFAVQLGIGYLGCGTPGTVVLTPTPGGSSNDCPAQPINWSQNGNNCTANMAFLTDGGTATISDPAPDPQGTVDIICSAGVPITSNAVCTGGSGPSTGCWEAPMVGGPALPGLKMPNICTVGSESCNSGDTISGVKCEHTDGVFRGFYSTICDTNSTPGDPQCVRNGIEPVTGVWECDSIGEVGNGCNQSATGINDPPCSPLGATEPASGGIRGPTGGGTFHPEQSPCGMLQTCDPIGRRCVTMAVCASSARCADS